MSDTRVDMAKVTQMLDMGCIVKLFRAGQTGSYIASATAVPKTLWLRAREKIVQGMVDAGSDAAFAQMLTYDDMKTPGEIYTDDFTPEQALTRLAYKVHGEII